MLTLSSVRTRGLCRALGWDYPTGAVFFFRALRLIPNVQPLLDRLQVARFKQVQLFHVSPLNHGSSVGDAC